MPFAYYDRLSRPEQAVYQLSALAPAFRLHRAKELWPLVAKVEAALRSGKRKEVELAAQALADGITSDLEVPRARIRVFLVRPSSEASELHGLYSASLRRAALIRLWMRTAKLGRVVAFRTFLRTLLHELCHHLDLELLGLPLSLHTEGFYRRESALFHQLVPSPEPEGAP